MSNVTEESSDVLEHEKEDLLSLCLDKLDSCGYDSRIGQEISDALSPLAEEAHTLGLQIERLASLLPTLSDGAETSQVSAAVIGALVGAFSAYLFNRFHWTVTQRKIKGAQIGEALCSMIHDLEVISVDYWLEDYREENAASVHSTEIAIKSKLRIISRYIRVMTPHLKSKIFHDIKCDLETFNFEIFDIVTGDEFETKRRKASQQRANSISVRCSDIRSKILLMDQ